MASVDKMLGMNSSTQGSHNDSESHYSASLDVVKKSALTQRPTTAGAYKPSSSAVKDLKLLSFNRQTKHRGLNTIENNAVSQASIPAGIKSGKNTHSSYAWLHRSNSVNE